MPEFPSALLALVAAIEKDFTPGSIEPTGRSTDLAIDGDGFFIVQGKEQKFTRDGSFTLNQANQLVTTAGDFVQGFGVDTNGNVVGGQPQNIQIPLGTLTKAKATTTASFQGNLNANGATSIGASTAPAYSGSSFTASPVSFINSMATVMSSDFEIMSSNTA